jgi:hypothetical protein
MDSVTVEGEDSEEVSTMEDSTTVASAEDSMVESVEVDSTSSGTKTELLPTTLKKLLLRLPTSIQSLPILLLKVKVSLSLLSPLHPRLLRRVAVTDSSLVLSVRRCRLDSISRT